MFVRRFIAVVAVALIALFGAMILAQERGQDPDEGKRVQRTRFDARDREKVGEWYKDHRDDLPPGFEPEDRLSQSAESSLRIGEQLDPTLRQNIKPAPGDLLQKLPPVAPGYRYEVLDGHLLILNGKTWRVSDVLHFERDFGRPWSAG